jgi:hypothetical protein
LLEASRSPENFYAKGDSCSQVAVQQSNLADAADVQRLKTY